MTTGSSNATNPRNKIRMLTTLFFINWSQQRKNIYFQPCLVEKMGSCVALYVAKQFKDVIVSLVGRSLLNYNQLIYLQSCSEENKKLPENLDMLSILFLYYHFAVVCLLHWSQKALVLAVSAAVRTPCTKLPRRKESSLQQDDCSVKKRRLDLDSSVRNQW